MTTKIDLTKLKPEFLKELSWCCQSDTWLDRIQWKLFCNSCGASKSLTEKQVMIIKGWDLIRVNHD